MRRILAQTRKELTQLVRDKMALALALVLPCTQLILMGSAISLTVADLPIAVQDLDDSPTSRTLIDAFRHSNTFRIVPFAVDRQPETAFTSNLARAALIIPARFGRDIARGVTSPVQMLIDASDSNTARLVSGYAAEVTAAWNADHGGGARVAPVQAAIRFWYNPGRRRKGSTDPASSCWDSRCFRRFLPRSPRRKKASRRPSCRSTYPAFRPMSFCWAKS